MREIVVDDLDKAITYRPDDRWNTSAKVGDDGIFWTVTEASTIYGANERTVMPEFSLIFSGMNYPAPMTNAHFNSSLSVRRRHHYMVCATFTLETLSRRC